MADNDDPNEALFAALQTQIEIIVADLHRDPVQTHWTAWMEIALAYIRKRDAAGVRYFKAAHGGMGSFNDWAALTEVGWAADETARDMAARLLRRNDLYDSGVDLRKNRAVPDSDRCGGILLGSTKTPHFRHFHSVP